MDALPRYRIEKPDGTPLTRGQADYPYASWLVAVRDAVMYAEDGNTPLRVTRDDGKVLRDVSPSGKVTP